MSKPPPGEPGPDHPAGEEQDLSRRLNRQLMRLMLCPPGSNVYTRELAQLFGDLAATGWLDAGELNQVVAWLIPRWRWKQVYALNRGYLFRIHRRLRRERLGREVEGLIAGQRDRTSTALDPALLVELEDDAAVFRGWLSDEDRRLFDAWVENVGVGWQKDYAQENGVSNTWVSLHLKTLRERMRKELGVQDPDAYVEALRMARGLREPVEDEQPQPESAPSAPTDDAGDESRFYQRLIDRLSVDPRWRRFILVVIDSTTWEEVAERFADHEAILDAMHVRFIELYELFRKEERCRGFYDRLVDRRNNLLGALGKARPPYPQAELNLASRIVSLAHAKPPTPFAELPARLGLSEDETLEVIGSLGGAFRRWDRARPRSQEP
jgi:hypothetical protein